MKMRPIKNEHYFYKCEEYVVTGFTTMKSTLGVTLVEAVQYVRADDIENNPDELFHIPLSKKSLTFFMPLFIFSIT